MTLLLIFLYGAQFLCGLLLMLAKDTAWRIVEWGNSTRGVASERTPRWETYSTVQGIVLALVGAILICRLVTSPGLIPAAQSTMRSAADASYPDTLRDLSLEGTRDGWNFRWLAIDWPR